MITEKTEITNFDDFCLWMYCIMEDSYRQIAPLFRRPGPASVCSDSELMAMVLIGECKGWNSELTLLSEWRNHPTLFPHVPSQSRFNRRRRNLWQAFNFVRKVVLGVLDVAVERQCCIDSLPMAVVQFKRVPYSSRAPAKSVAE